MNREPGLLLNRKACAALLGLSTRSIDLLLADDRLTPVRMGHRVLVARKQIEELATTGVWGRIRPD